MSVNFKICCGVPFFRIPTHHIGHVKVGESLDIFLQKKFHFSQECIPVGCVLSAAVAISGGGVCPGGGCLPRRRVSAQEGVSAQGVSACWVSAQGVSVWGGVCQEVSSQGVYTSPS